MRDYCLFAPPPPPNWFPPISPFNPPFPRFPHSPPISPVSPRFPAFSLQFGKSGFFGMEPIDPRKYVCEFSMFDSVVLISYYLHPTFVYYY